MAFREVCMLCWLLASGGQLDAEQRCAADRGGAACVQDRDESLLLLQNRFQHVDREDPAYLSNVTQLQDAIHSVTDTVAQEAENVDHTVQESLMRSAEPASSATAGALETMAERLNGALNLIDSAVVVFVSVSATAKKSLEEALQVTQQERLVLSAPEKLQLYESVMDKALGPVLHAWGDLKALLQTITRTVTASLTIVSMPSVSDAVNATLNQAQDHADKFTHSFLCSLNSAVGLSRESEAVALERHREVRGCLDSGLSELDAVSQDFQKAFALLADGVPAEAAASLTESGAARVASAFDATKSAAGAVMVRVVDSFQDMAGTVLQLSSSLQKEEGGAGHRRLAGGVGLLAAWAWLPRA